MAWLTCNGVRVAPLEVPAYPMDNGRGLLGRTEFEGALILQPAFLIHTFGMRFALDVAYCDASGHVIGAVTMGRHRLGRPRIRSRAVIEASAGSFAQWGVAPGCQLAIERD